MGFVGNDRVGCVMWGFSWVGCLGAWVWMGVRVAWGVGMDNLVFLAYLGMEYGNVWSKI